MKKQIALVLAVAAFLMTACDPENPGPTPPPQTNARPAATISSIYPNSGAPGSNVSILGENFGALIEDNHVSFDSTSAQIVYVGPRSIIVRVPMSLADGDYAINLVSEGSVTSAPRLFRVINNPR